MDEALIEALLEQQRQQEYEPNALPEPTVD